MPVTKGDPKSGYIVPAKMSPEMAEHAATLPYASVTGALLWWKRQSRRAPPKAERAPARAVAVIMLVVALAFPLSAAALLGIILLDVVLTARKAAKA